MNITYASDLNYLIFPTLKYFVNYPQNYFTAVCPLFSTIFLKMSKTKRKRNGKMKESPEKTLT